VGGAQPCHLRAVCPLLPLVPHYSWVPTLDIRSFAPSLWQGLGYGLLLLLVYGFYLGAYRSAQAAPLRLGAILGVAVLLALPLLFVYPINAADIFRYFIRGRLTAFYGASPLAVAPVQFAGDPFLPLAGEWAGETSPYGPVWELIAGAIAAISGENLLLALLLFKGLALAAHLGSAALIWRQQQRQRAQGGAYAALGLEPGAVADVRRRRA
jgi:hypothetical protein